MESSKRCIVRRPESLDTHRQQLQGGGRGPVPRPGGEHPLQDGGGAGRVLACLPQRALQVATDSHPRGGAHHTAKGLGWAEQGGAPCGCRDRGGISWLSGGGGEYLLTAPPLLIRNLPKFHLMSLPPTSESSVLLPACPRGMFLINRMHRPLSWARQPLTLASRSQLLPGNQPLPGIAVVACAGHLRGEKDVLVTRGWSRAATAAENLEGK